MALNAPETEARIILTLLRWNPQAAVEVNSKDEFPLHQILKAAKRRHLGLQMDQVLFVGTILETNVDSLVVQDSCRMHPFVIAAKEGWSLDVVYGLLRTNPLVIETYV